VKEIDRHTHTKEKAKKVSKKKKENTHTQMYSLLMNLKLFYIKSEVK